MSYYSLSALASDLVNGLVDGFTLNTVMMEPVENRGYSVGGHPECSELRLRDVKGAPVGLVAETLRFYAQTVGLYGEGRMGGWVHEGDLYLDAPTIFWDEEEAAQVSRERGEKAFFDLAAGVEIMVGEV